MGKINKPYLVIENVRVGFLGWLRGLLTGVMGSVAIPSASRLTLNGAIRNIDTLTRQEGDIYQRSSNLTFNIMEYMTRVPILMYTAAQLLHSPQKSELGELNYLLWITNGISLAHELLRNRPRYSRFTENFPTVKEVAKGLEGFF